ncbi:MAG: hypothetical protein IJ489_04690 [Clostridia bacterium]|nr:hypothetical protein [Clostridia bacterium]
MSEYYNNDENYEEELIYREKSTIDKIFSMRTLKTIVKGIMWVLVVIVYGMIFFRLCTGKPPKSISGLLWTSDTYAAYEKYGDELKIYSHEPVENIAEDGVSGIYDVVYIPAAKTLQMTVRYNKNLAEEYYENQIEARRNAIEDSVIKSEGYERANLANLTSEERERFNALIEERLAKSLEEDPINVSDSEYPFVFVLRDNYGNVYAKYEYLSDTKTLYHYQRLSFSGIDLFGEEQTAPKNAYPSPEAADPAYIYKGAHASESNAVTYLYLDMYYEKEIDVNGEAFSYPLQVYTSEVELELYGFSKEIPTGLTEGLSEKFVENTNP